MTRQGRTAEARRLLDDRQAWSRLKEMLPEVAALAGVPQTEICHREGDALQHTLLALEQVRGDEDKRVFWAVLPHDVGKAGTTHFEDSRWRSSGHAEAGADVAKAALERLGLEEMAEEVAWLVRHHQFHLSWEESVRYGLTRRQRRFCRQRLFPLLVRVAQADAAASVGESRKGELLDCIVRWAEAEGNPLE